MKPSNKTSDCKAAYLSFVKYVGSKVVPCEHSVQQFESVAAPAYEQMAQEVPRIVETNDHENERERKLVGYLLSPAEAAAETSEAGQALSHTRKSVIARANSTHHGSDPAFEPTVSHARFPGLVAISNGFSIHAEQDSRVLVATDEDGSKDLTLF